MLSAKTRYDFGLGQDNPICDHQIHIPAVGPRRGQPEVNLVKQDFYAMRRDVKDSPRWPGARGLCLRAQKSVSRELVQNVVDRRKANFGPLAHSTALDKLFDFISVDGLFRNQSQDGEFRVGDFIF
jgi:hypothetical protein